MALREQYASHADLSMGDFLLTVFGAYLARLSRVSLFDLGFRDVALQQAVKGSKKRLASHVPLRVDVSGAQSFSDLLQSMQEELALIRAHKSYAHDIATRYPTLRSVPEWRPEQVWPVVVEQVEALWHMSLLSHQKAISPLTMVIPEGETKFRWVYDTQMLDQKQIAKMVQQFTIFLEGIAAHPDALLGELPLLPEEERHQLLVEFNDTAADYAQDRSLHQLFEAQVSQTPDAVALVLSPLARPQSDMPSRPMLGEKNSAGNAPLLELGGEGPLRVTYQELNRQANQLANYLRTLGVGPDILVGINIKRSLEMVVGILGVLKAGGAYVPLDPSYPEERLAFILQDTKAPVLLTQEHLIEGLPDVAHHATVVCVDRDWHLIAQATDENPVSGVTPHNLAYVIYTSGSTGKPKGVAIEHRSPVTLIDWALDFFPDTPARAAKTSRLPGLFKGTLFSTSICFDLSVFELFVPLSCGGKVILAENALHLSTLPAANEVTLINTVPSAIAALLRANSIPPSVETVILAGEPLKTSLVEQIYQQKKIKQVFDLYGPSEDTTYSTHALRRPNGRATIGRPIANTQIYLLDSYLQPVPLGVPGQIYIGGDGLARGYLNRPELTAERFIPNPFGDAPGTRLYNTGDLARYRPDGKLEFLGRIDDQVKIRGYRIELGEIEAVLSQHPAVRENVVVVNDAPSGGKRLLGYVVPEKAPQPKHDPLLQKQVTQWQIVWDETYRDQELTQPFHSWKSSYSGQPIPEEEMQEWLDHTVERILTLQPNRVLELGCGTGLLLFEIAPYTLQYWASDFSEVSLHYIERVLAQSKYSLPQVKLFQQAANDFTGLTIEKTTFDAVIINSVVQYFPDMDYLVTVLEQAVNVVAQGGFIMIGDVRHLPLLEAFHTSVQLHNAPDSLTKAELKQRVKEQVAQEQELVIDATFFQALQQHLPQISHVEIQLKRGRAHNELTRFRYDVILHIGRRNALDHTPSQRLLASSSAGKTIQVVTTSHLPTLYQHLRDNLPEFLSIKNVPNPRLMTELKALEWLASDNGPQTVGEFRQTNGRAQQVGIEPEELWAFAHHLPYLIDITWSSSGELGSYDVLFRQRHATQKGADMPPLELERVRGRRVPETTTKGEQNDRQGTSLQAESAHKAWREYANNPLQAQQTRQLIPQLRRYLKEKLPEYMVPSLFMTLDALPLTPNGKVNRRALPAPALSRAAEEEGFVAPRNSIEQLLADIWSEVLGLQHVGIHDNFFELGGDSILNIRILAKANQAGLRLTAKQLWDQQTIAELALVTPISQTIQAEQGIVTGPVPLTAYYHWFFEQKFADPHHWNMPILLEVRQPMERVLLQQTIQQLLAHHDALRMRFEHTPSGWQAFNAGLDNKTSFLWVDLSTLPVAEQQATMQKRAADLQASLNLSQGPLVRVAYFDFGAKKPAYLLFIVHHLVVDGVSWLILLEDLQTAYQQLTRGEALQLPPKSTSFKKWAKHLAEYVQSGALDQELPYWLTLAEKTEPFYNQWGRMGEPSRPTAPNTVSSSQIVSVSLNVPETEALLREVPAAYNTQINDILLTGLLLTYAQWTGAPALLIDLEGHGREDIIEEVDLSRTVSGFTSIFPVLLELPTKKGWKNGKNSEYLTKNSTNSEYLTKALGEVLKSVKEQLRAIPKRGIGYGLLRYLSPDTQVRDQLRALPKPQLIFNYLGQFDKILPDSSFFTLSQEPCGPIYSPHGRRTHLIEINSFVAKGQLRLDWTYSQNHHQPATIEQLAHNFIEQLRALITHCQSPDAGGYTASDFEEAELSQQELEELLMELGEL